ncbi:MAG: EAL domain-containing protein [Nitrospirae bacterium]|nr:EAL domain-containing protein [Nitrospirota bacterium]
MINKHLNILLVEDDEDDFILTRDLLYEVEGVSYDIEWASTYETALEAIKRKCHDIYLFDYRLGERTGLELLRTALDSGSKVPVILMTGQGDKEIDMEAMSAGASDYLVKGHIDAQLLERSIRYAVERKKANDQISHMAYYDSLTNLHNRISFKESLKQTITINKGCDKITALLFLDLDNFKRINDTFGHTVGDDLLKEVADRLKKCVRKSDCIARNVFNETNHTIARLGGDEFTIVLSAGHIHDAANAAQRILDALSSPFELEGDKMFITASIGIAVHPLDGEDVETLIKNADAAMYHAKELDKNNYQFYKKSLNETSLRRLTVENSLRKAVENCNFTLLYQPKMEISTGKIVGMEALIRWEDPEEGMISPTEFIPLAEEMGLINPIGEWVLRTACAQNMSWQKAGLTPIRVSINMSGRQFKQKNLITMVSDILNDTGLDPRYLELEITESIVMENVNTTIATLNDLKKMGLRLSMDDFGTGYSSFSYLKRIPLDIIKIDQTFIKDIHSDPQDRTIINAIIVMAHSLGMEVIAEGVETERQLSFLVASKCREIQGFLLSSPLTSAEATECLEKEALGDGIGVRLYRKITDRFDDITAVQRVIRQEEGTGRVFDAIEGNACE